MRTKFNIVKRSYNQMKIQHRKVLLSLKSKVKMDHCDINVSTFSAELISNTKISDNKHVNYVELHNQIRIPLVGLGTYRLRGEDVVNPVVAALKTGYRHIDTASVYRNEEMIGLITDHITNSQVNPHAIERKNIFITTKLAPKDQGFDKANLAIDKSLKKLGGCPIDLFLIHWPGCAGKKLDDPEIATIRLETWRALEKALSDGKVRAIGVSNFQPKHLNHLLENCKIVPHVNQIEFHPACQQHEILKLCKQHNIQVVAYSSLGVGNLLQHSVVLNVARRIERTPAQVLLRWGIQKGVCVIPKASSTTRIEENYNIFDFKLNRVDMEELDAICKEYPSSKHFCWNPENVQY